MNHKLLNLRPVVLLGLLFISCGSPPEVKYEGLPLSVWVERLASPDEAVRQDALRVIATAGTAARRVEYFVLKSAREETNPDVKMEAVRTLAAMDAPTIEFEEFVKLYQGPIIPSEEEQLLEIDSIEVEFGDKISGNDDLEYLKDLAEGRLDGSDDTPSTSKDSAGVLQWDTERLASETRNILESLSNPQMLREILLSGSDLEREYAARKLAEQSGVSEVIVEALKKAASDPNSKIAEAAQAALKNWENP